MAKPKNPAPDPAASGGGKKKLIIMIAAAVLLLGGGGGAWFFLSAKKEKEAAAANAEAAEERPEPPAHGGGAASATPVFLALDPFTLNLRGTGRFLQTAFTLHLKTDDDSAKVKMYLPQIRSRILLLLSGKTAEELGQVEGKSQLLNEIQELLEEPMAPGMRPVKVLNVLITSFVIQ